MNLRSIPEAALVSLKATLSVPKKSRSVAVTAPLKHGWPAGWSG